MNLFTYSLNAGELKSWYGTGRYLRLLSGTAPVEVGVRYGSGAMVSTPLIVGIGVDLRHPETGEPFTGLSFLSEAAQNIQVLATHFPSTDSRLAGDVDLSGMLEVVAKAGSGWVESAVPLDPATPGALLVGPNGNRVNVTVQADQDMWIGATPAVTTAAGIKVGAGQTVNIENTAALYAAVEVQATARVMESVR